MKKSICQLLVFRFGTSEATEGLSALNIVSLRLVTLVFSNFAICDSNEISHNVNVPEVRVGETVNIGSYFLL